jgi:hypothetical protein
MLMLQLFCYWYFLANGPGSSAGMATHVGGSVLAAWSIYNGVKWHFKVKDGEGLAWAIIGGLVFLGLTARWLVAVG